MATFRPRLEDSADVFTTADWLESIELADPAGGDVMSNEGADATLQIVIPANKMRSALVNILGYSWADDQSPWALHRQAPVSHPIWGTQLRASAVTFDRFQPIGNTDNPNNSPYLTSPVVFDTITRYAKYGVAKATVRFSPRPYYLYETGNTEWDADPKEFRRWTESYQVEPNLELISADGGQNTTVYFVDGPANDPKGKNFPGTLSERISNTRFKMVWNEVPERFLFNDNFLPQKILNCVGRVNSDWFPKVGGLTGTGFPPGTLLCEAPRFERFLYPWFSTDGRAFHYRVTLSLLHFDPPQGSGTTLTNDRGWRLFPWKHGNGSGGPGWYPARRGKTTGDAYYIQEVDFATMFTHVKS